MDCINVTSLEQQKRRLTPTIRGEINRDLVTQMHALEVNQIEHSVHLLPSL